MSTLPFHWCGPSVRSGCRLHYNAFSLGNQVFSIGDCVYLFPEDDAHPPYLGRIRSAFVDESAVGVDPPPHNIEVKWFERRVNLETSTKGIIESEKEVFELEDTDVNPIGCISGKCHIIRARNFDEAQSSVKEQQQQHDWYFCRGYYLQATNSFRPYTTAELETLEVVAVAAPSAAASAASAPAPPAAPAGSAPPTAPPLLSTAMATATTAAPPRLDPGVQVSSLTPPSVSSAIAQPVARPSPVLTSLAPTHVPVAVASTVQQPEQISPEPQLAAAAPKGASGSAAQEKAAAGPGSRAAEDRPSGGAPAAKRKATGRVCVECGATSTPQWREGPAGPKTLCNACGVRALRSQQRANKAKAAAAAGAAGGKPLAAQSGQQGSSPPSSGGGRGRGKSAALDSRADAARSAPETSGRPVRQAAIAALSRTAAFARTGEFPDDDPAPSAPGGHSRRVGGAGAAGASGRPAGASVDSSHLSTGGGTNM